MTEEARNQWIDKQIKDWVLPNCADRDEAERALNFFSLSNFREHSLRFLLTYENIKRSINLKDKDLAETGHLSGLSHYLISLGHDVKELEGDFRYKIEAEDSAFDIVFSFEVLEHIKDQDATCFDDLVLFNYSGAEKFSLELARILRPGGSLVLTTPNPSSLYSFEQVIKMEPSWVYQHHVREYTQSEVVKMFAKAGFRCDHFTTQYSCFYLDHAYIRTLLDKYFPDEPDRFERRGDDSLFIFTRL